MNSVESKPVIRESNLMIADSNYRCIGTGR